MGKLTLAVEKHHLLEFLNLDYATPTIGRISDVNYIWHPLVSERENEYPVIATLSDVTKCYYSDVALLEYSWTLRL